MEQCLTNAVLKKQLTQLSVSVAPFGSNATPTVASSVAITTLPPSPDCLSTASHLLSFSILPTLLPLIIPRPWGPPPSDSRVKSILTGQAPLTGAVGGKCELSSMCEVREAVESKTTCYSSEELRTEEEEDQLEIKTQKMLLIVTQEMNKHLQQAAKLLSLFEM
ncbi:unnamed protein product [Pleuronectes platessa]|uniref:Uncharacterized protein n=1 Tax=Pleuronectes platessa TaxID=8262 RepID=A0A9N7W0T3_PLEPL|nr:unnamed protein product [Pleuronectes platessa]